MDLELPMPIVDGYIATPHCRDIGKVWHLRPALQSKWESFLVVDCAGPDALDWMLEHGILVEVDYKTAERWDTINQWQSIERRMIIHTWRVVDVWKVPTNINQPMYRRYK